MPARIWSHLHHLAWPTFSKHHCHPSIYIIHTTGTTGSQLNVKNPEAFFNSEDYEYNPAPSSDYFAVLIELSTKFRGSFSHLYLYYAKPSFKHNHVLVNNFVIKHPNSK